MCGDEWMAASNALPNKWLEPTGARANFLQGTDGGVAWLRSGGRLLMRTTS